VYGLYRVMRIIPVKCCASKYVGAFFQLTSGLICAFVFSWFYGGM
jgi:hypothetical protein